MIFVQAPDGTLTRFSHDWTAELAHMGTVVDGRQFHAVDAAGIAALPPLPSRGRFALFVHAAIKRAGHRKVAETFLPGSFR